MKFCGNHLRAISHRMHALLSCKWIWNYTIRITVTLAFVPSANGLYKSCFPERCSYFTCYRFTCRSNWRLFSWKCCALYMEWSIPNLHGPLARYAILWVAHAPEMPGTSFPPLRVSDPDVHHGTCVTHVPWCMPEIANQGFYFKIGGGENVPGIPGTTLRNLQCWVSGKRPMLSISFYTQQLSSWLCMTLQKTCDISAVSRYWYFMHSVMFPT